MAQTVLVADDSIASQRLFEMVLTREGYNVVTVGSGAEILERVKEKHPDLALVDAIMPEVDGYQICQTLRKDPAFKNLPVIMLAGMYEDFDREKGAKIVGAGAILDKPSKSHVIVSKVKELLRQQEQRDEEQEVPPTPVKATPKGAQPPKTKTRTGVIQEPTFIEETYDFDEDSEEVDLAVESEILDEEAEWEETEEEQELLSSEEDEEEVEEELLEEPEVAPTPPPREAVPAEDAVPPISSERLTLSDDNLDAIAEEIAKRVAGKLVPVLMQSFTTYFLQIPSVKQVVESASKNLVQEILPEIQGKLK
jgi:CheY-like chemotaxis protein